MMNEMIERVARALATEHFNKNKHKGYCTQKERVQYLVNEYWKNHINDAKAAIQAMREPTEAIKNYFMIRDIKNYQDVVDSVLNDA